MSRSTPIWDDDGPEYEKPEETREERIKRLEMQKRITDNQSQMLVDVVEAFRKGWTKQ
jgi:hypothetical protein